MPNGQNEPPGMTWLAFALMTVVSWGVYGVFLHKGQTLIASSPNDPNARYQAFLFVGIAYFLTAVLAPLAILMKNGASWQMPVPGMAWSLVAGIVGAIGAFCVLLAFGAQGKPPVVMSIVFAGAPIVNALVAFAMHPPKAGFGSFRWQFLLGLALAAAGGYLVTLYRPMDRPAHAAARPAPQAHD